MTTKLEPGDLRKVVSNFASASPTYLAGSAFLILLGVKTTDGQTAHARAQLMLLNERLEARVSKVKKTPKDDLFDFLGSLLSVRDMLWRSQTGARAGETETADFASLICAVDLMAEAARRAIGREGLIKKDCVTEAA